MSNDPRTGENVRYAPEAEAALEQAHQAGQHKVRLDLGPISVTVDLRAMMQVTDRGGKRKCWREEGGERGPPSRGKQGSFGGGTMHHHMMHHPMMHQHMLSHAGLFGLGSGFMGRAGGRDEGPPPAPVSCLSRAEMHRLLAAIQEYDRALASATRDNGYLEESKLGELGLPADAMPLLQHAYNHMFSRFEEQRFRRKYGAMGREGPRLKDGEPVPPYFANVQDHSIHRRKELSIAGLRNLARLGPEIYRELARHKFAGRPDVYSSGEGINKMRLYTGNVVDLDTTVLRASDRTTVAAINAMNRHQGLKVWSCPQEFGDSQQATSIAKAAASELCDRFVADLGLSQAAARERHVLSSAIATPLPVASHNTHRGMWPLWRYVNAGQDSFHANVPTMSDVVGALLKAPYHCAQLWVVLHTTFSGEELERRVDSFFEDAVSDTCFNMKWKAIEEFADCLSREGTIVDVLQKLQQQHQEELTVIFDGDDQECTHEKAKMWELAQGRFGRDKTGCFRAITREDCVRWVDDPAIIL